MIRFLLIFLMPIVAFGKPDSTELDKSVNRLYNKIFLDNMLFTCDDNWYYSEKALSNQEIDQRTIDKMQLLDSVKLSKEFSFGNNVRLLFSGKFDDKLIKTKLSIETILNINDQNLLNEPVNVVVNDVNVRINKDLQMLVPTAISKQENIKSVSGKAYFISQYADKEIGFEERDKLKLKKYKTQNIVFLGYGHDEAFLLMSGFDTKFDFHFVADDGKVHSSCGYRMNSFNFEPRVLLRTLNEKFNIIYDVQAENEAKELILENNLDTIITLKMPKKTTKIVFEEPQSKVVKSINFHFTFH